MAIGKVGSFASTEAPKDPLLDTLQNIEQVGFQKRVEDRLIADKKEKAKKEEDDALALNLATFQGKPTGVYNLDNVQFGLAKESASAYAENEKKIRATTDPNEKAKYQLANLNLKNNFNNAKGGIDLFFNKYKEVQDRIKSGNINPEDEKDLLNDVQSLNNMGVRVDENGNWKFSTYQKDDKGNLTNVVVNDSDMSGVLGIMDRFSKSNYGDFKKQFLADNKLSETDIQTGYTKNVNRQVDDRIKQQAMNAGIAIANQDSEMYQKMLEMDGIKKRKFTDEDRKRVANYVANDLVKSYEDYYKKEIDQSGILAAQKEARDKKKEEQANPVIGSGTITSQEGVVEGTNVNIPKGSKTFAIANAERKLGTGKIEKLKEVRRKPNGSLVFVVQETYEGENVQSKQLSKEGKEKEAFNLKNAQAIKDKKVQEKVIYSDDYETVTTSSKRPTTKAYDTEGGNADDAENFAIMLINPDTGEYFQGLKEAKSYFDKKASGITSEGKKPTAQELIEKYRTKK